MKKKKKPLTIEEVFPNAAGRKAGDEAIDLLDPKLPMTAFLDAYEAAYFTRCGRSPFRGKTS